MQATEEQVRPKFKGSGKSSELAEQVFNAIGATARFFASSATIQVPLDSVVEYVTSTNGEKGASREDIEKALRANKHIFVLKSRDDVTWVLTTRTGEAPILDIEEDLSHSFAKRFQDPPPVPEGLPARRSIGSAVQAETDDQTADLTESGHGSVDFDSSDEGEGSFDFEPTVTEPVVEKVAAPSDLSDITDEELAEAFRIQLGYDFQVASFGDQWMVEERVPRLSRGDLRRIRDYINEQGQPVSDHQIVQDLLGIRQTAQEYDLHLFSVNFRLSRETRDFEFVGIAGFHQWAVAGFQVPAIAGRKPAEVGQDYRVLLELDDDPIEGEEGVVEHVLTFYEYQHGVLPFDAAFQTIIPGPVLEGQRSAILSFESPSTFQNFSIEVRFPTSNRGGYLAGFAEFFHEHLVPGAFVTIEVGDMPGKYTIEFLTVSGQDRKLLTLDSKKNKYAFESKTFYCAPNEDMLISENRFPKLAGAEPLDDRTRRQPEAVLAHAFQLVGEKVDDQPDGQLMAVLDELVAAANIERPLPAELIRRIAASEQSAQFSLDPEADDVIYYQPGTS